MMSSTWSLLLLFNFFYLETYQRKQCKNYQRKQYNASNFIMRKKILNKNNNNYMRPIIKAFLLFFSLVQYILRMHRDFICSPMITFSRYIHRRPSYIRPWLPLKIVTTNHTNVLLLPQLVLIRADSSVYLGKWGVSYTLGVGRP